MFMVLKKVEAPSIIMIFINQSWFMHILTKGHLSHPHRPISRPPPLSSPRDSKISALQKKAHPAAECSESLSRSFVFPEVLSR